MTQTHLGREPSDAIERSIENEGAGVERASSSKLKSGAAPTADCRCRRTSVRKPD